MTKEELKEKLKSTIFHIMLTQHINDARPYVQKETEDGIEYQYLTTDAFVYIPARMQEIRITPKSDFLQEEIDNIGEGDAVCIPGSGIYLFNKDRFSVVEGATQILISKFYNEYIEELKEKYRGI